MSALQAGLLWHPAGMTPWIDVLSSVIVITMVVFCSGDRPTATWMLLGIHEAHFESRRLSSLTAGLHCRKAAMTSGEDCQS